MWSLYNGRMFVRPSVCPVDGHLLLAAAWASAAYIDRYLPASRTGYQ